MRRRFRAICGVALTLVLTGCSTHRAAPATGPVANDAVIYDGEIDEVMPVRDGDWYLYKTTRQKKLDTFERSELTATDTPNEFRLTVYENKSPIARAHMRVDPDAVRIVSQMDLRNDIGIIYTPPLPLVISPVRSLSNTTAQVEVVRVSDGTVLDSGNVELTISSRLDQDSGDIISRVDRRMAVSSGVLPSTYTMRIKPGRGQISTDNGFEQRELICGKIDGSSIGTCPK